MVATLSAAAIAELLQGELHADANISVRGVNTLLEAGEGEASFLANAAYKQHLKETSASLVLVEHNLPEALCAHLPHIRLKDPYLGFALLQRHFHPLPQGNGEVHPSAVVHETARLGPRVQVGAQAVIGAGVVIDEACIIAEGCVIGEQVSIGAGSLLYPRCVVAAHCVLGERVILQAGAVIGSDGFGYAWDGRQHLKIPQTGRVVLEDDVEVGANTCIDRGALGDTVIRRGAKLDNLIQIGHNVEIGHFSIMASQVGISGSTKIGKGCQIGGQVGMAGHIHVGDGAKIAAKSGVIGDLDAGGTYAGIPAIQHRVWLKASMLMTRLPEMWKLLQKIKS